MPSLSILSSKIWFPPAKEALEDGLLAMGGDLSTERLLYAYRRGIFPWFEGKVPLWWCPNPRFVLFPEKLKVSKSMLQVFRKGQFQFSRNNCFTTVMENCGSIGRKGQMGTWITEEMLQAYQQLHKIGVAHSFEAWQNETLVGGFYGLLLGNVFFGESMFSRVSNASKAIFIHAVQNWLHPQVKLIDCQTHTSHLESLGAEMIPRSEFLNLLKDLQ